MPSDDWLDCWLPVVFVCIIILGVVGLIGKYH